MMGSIAAAAAFFTINFGGIQVLERAMYSYWNLIWISITCIDKVSLYFFHPADNQQQFRLLSPIANVDVTAKKKVNTIQ